WDGSWEIVNGSHDGAFVDWEHFNSGKHYSVHGQIFSNGVLHLTYTVDDGQGNTLNSGRGDFTRQ
ncbi:MAG TPA: hypothetical protein VMS17_22500, partial [Gemmataceae bacterium]|nr:hypothetical protein [Gemmataceae bacterium]